MEQGVKNAVKDFFSRLKDEKLWIENDIVWPQVANKILDGKDENFQLGFWHELEKLFKEKERKFGHLHKGQIYWKLAIIYLGKGEVSKSIDFLEKAVHEDKKRGDNFSAAIGLLSVLKPLVIRFKEKREEDHWVLDENIRDFYDSLLDEEKKGFAAELGLVHDIIITSQVNVIKDDFFDFIVSEDIRSIIKEIYTESRDIILRKNLRSYFSCVFAIGAIIEGMLDDLFQRDDQKIWIEFHDNEGMQQKINDEGSILKSSEYQKRMSLGQKIRVLIIMAESNILVVSRSSILKMLIIDEYRNLIHPRRTIGFEHRVNWYVAAFLFNFISHIASDLWPENVNSQLRLSKK